MLYNGEEVGSGSGPSVDVAVDPVDGTTLTAKGMSNAISVLAVAERRTMYDPSAVFYMDKVVTGPGAADVVDITAPPAENVRRVAKAKGERPEGVTVVILDRPRHEELVAAVRETGARIRFLSDGDVAGAIMTAREGTGVDLLLGVGGTPEGIITACAMKCLEGRSRPGCGHATRPSGAGRSTRDMISTPYWASMIWCVATTFSSWRPALPTVSCSAGVRYRTTGARTHSIVMRSLSGTVRTIEGEHRADKVRHLTGFDLATAS